MAKLITKILTGIVMLLLLSIMNSFPASSLAVDVPDTSVGEINLTAEATDDIKEKEELLGSATSGVEELADNVEDVIGSVEVKELTDDGNVIYIITDATEGSLGSAPAKIIGHPHSLKAVSNPELTEEEKDEIITKAMNVPELNDWSSGGWEFVSMDFVGTLEEGSGEAEWERAIVYLQLPDGSGNPPEECPQGWSATIEVNLETGNADSSGVPRQSSHQCTSRLVLEDPDTAKSFDIMKSLPFSSLFIENTKTTSSIKPGFVIAEADHVVSNKVYGNIAYLKTPSYKSEIFDHMDSYVAYLLNQKWNTSPMQYMTQIGWLITSVEGCVDCGAGYIPENTAVLTFTDTSVFGNLEAHRIPFDWKQNLDMLAETVCNDDTNYLISILYDDKIFNHNTKVPCDNADNDSKISNSIFFENWNTVPSSSWAQDITGPVQAHSTYGFINSQTNFAPWTSSTNEEQSCSGRDLTAIINGDLSSGSAATWTELSKTPAAC